METALRENIQAVTGRIREAARRAGRRAEEITLVAVTKTVGPERIAAAFAQGITHFGESRIQEAQMKIDALRAMKGIKWHFIGHLQTNKAKAAVAEGFEAIHSLNSIKLLQELERQAERLGKTQKVFVEVKIMGEGSKHGIPEDQLAGFLEEAKKAPHIEVAGLMTIPPFFEDTEKTRPYYRRLRALRDEAQKKGISLPHLSMGMSHDFETAVEEGATILRVGTAIFGPREA